MGTVNLLCGREKRGGQILFRELIVRNTVLIQLKEIISARVYTLYSGHFTSCHPPTTSPLASYLLESSCGDDKPKSFLSLEAEKTCGNIALALGKRSGNAGGEGTGKSRELEPARAWRTSLHTTPQVDPNKAGGQAETLPRIPKFMLHPIYLVISSFGNIFKLPFL